MKSIVVNIMDDVCAKNGRDPEGTKLIEIAKTFGSVESLDSVMAAEREKSQQVINSLTAQLESIKEQKVTPEELKVLRVVRDKSAAERSELDAAIASRDAQLKAIQVENENRAAKIKAIYGF